MVRSSSVKDNECELKVTTSDRLKYSRFAGSRVLPSLACLPQSSLGMHLYKFHIIFWQACICKNFKEK